MPPGCRRCCRLTSRCSQAAAAAADQLLPPLHLPAAVEDIDAHITELEHRIQHDSLTLNEEKKAMEQIKALKKSRRW